MILNSRDEATELNTFYGQASFVKCAKIFFVGSDKVEVRESVKSVQSILLLG